MTYEMLATIRNALALLIEKRRSLGTDTRVAEEAEQFIFNEMKLIGRLNNGG